jgi:transposase InsO family protein
MNVHKNARTTPFSRGVLVRRVLAGAPVAEVAADFSVSERTVFKWLARFRSGGEAALQDRSSRPRRQSGTAMETVAAIEALRRQRLTSPVISRALGIPVSTVTLVLRRLGLNRLKALDPVEPKVRYERQRPGELIHIDTKKLGRIDGVGHRATGDRRDRTRGAGWEHLHVAIDDASRLAYTELLPADNGEACAGFLTRAAAWFAQLGIRIERVMTDNALAYVQSTAFRTALTRIGAKHITTRPYRPRTNGKAERFIQTALREWAYAKAYQRSDHRGAELPLWLHRYNWHRPHGSIGAKPPISRLGLTGNNLLRLHS